MSLSRCVVSALKTILLHTTLGSKGDCSIELEYTDYKPRCSAVVAKIKIDYIDLWCELSSSWSYA